MGDLLDLGQFVLLVAGFDTCMIFSGSSVASNAASPGWFTP